jgi:8-oxo-dGTP pyrophosphatase MutT (NUDIX family)
MSASPSDRFRQIAASVKSLGLSAKESLDLILGLMKDAGPQVTDAAIVRASLDVHQLNENGEAIKDTVSGAGANTLEHVSKWPRQASGSTVYAAAKYNGEYHVLVAQQPKRPDMVIFPGGYKKPGDTSLNDTARREFAEETGIKASPKDVRVVNTDSRHGISNTPDLDTINQHTLFDYGVMNELPIASGQDDVAWAKWVPVSAFKRNPDVTQPQMFGSQESRFLITIDGKTSIVRDDHGENLERSLQILRENELKAVTSSRERVESIARLAEQKAELPMGALLPVRPVSELGPEAEAYQKKALQIAQLDMGATIVAGRADVNVVDLLLQEYRKEVGGQGSWQARVGGNTGPSRTLQ